MDPAPTIPATEYPERRRRAARLGRARGHDVLLVWSRGGSLDSFSDVHYFTGHYSPMVWVPPVPGVLSGCEHACLVIAEDGAGVLFVSDFRSQGVQVEEVRDTWDMAAAVADHLHELGVDGGSVGVIGVEVFPYGIGAYVRQALPSLRLEAADDISAELRLRLSESEVAMLTHAGAVGVRIYEEFLAHVVPGATEGEAIGAALALAAQIPGCAHWNFLAASGNDADALIKDSIPPWRASRRYERGDTVHADCYGYVEGYCYDLARTVFAGGAQTPAQESVAASTSEAVAAAAELLRPGVTSGELRRAAAEALHARGLTPVAGSFGHGIGAGFFRPYLLPAGPDLDRPLQPPFGFSIEIFATDEAGNYAYHEDNFVVLEQETRCVTQVRLPPTPARS